ncbi:hypothetical protein A2335_02205 [Candidatus Peregrinibacteria bacterium RIFOXYB2_FULL_32_7]|nr:MAG: hypothetical protein A2335_02205 [Candidatus Peregrinibacteria bacterium RIFOXYB2_FULL_32_7]
MPIKIFLKLIRKNFFKPGFILEALNSETKIKTILASANYPHDLNINDIMHLQKFGLSICEIYALIRYLIIGGILNNIFLYLFLSTLTFYIPIFYLKTKAFKRQKIFEKQLPNIIDLLILAIQGGLNLEYAIEHIGLTVKNVCGEEFLKISNEIKFGISLNSALENLLNRIKSSDLNRFITLLKQSKNLGVSLSTSLKIQAEIIRTIKRQTAEELARTASIKIMAPLILCIFPALLIIYLAPGIIQFLKIS